MNHPCKDCRFYIDTVGPQGKVRCPVVGAEITAQRCTYTSTTYPERAQRLIRRVKDKMVRNERQKAGLQGVLLL